jgi:hypothetical protein
MGSCKNNRVISESYDSFAYFFRAGAYIALPFGQTIIYSSYAN